MAKAKVTIEAVGEAQLRRAVRGVRSEMQQADRQSERAARRSTEVAEQQARRRSRAGEQEARATSRAAKRSSDERIRQERSVTRETERQSRSRVRTLRQAARTTGRLIAGGAAALAGGAVAGGSHLLGRAQAYGGALGVRSREQLIPDLVRFEQRLVALSSKLGLDETQTTELRGRINDTSRARGVDQEQVIGVLSQAQSRFAEQFDFFNRNMSQILAGASAAEARPEDVVTFLGNARRANPELDDETILRSFYENIDRGLRGSVEFGALAQAFGTLPGQFAANTQRTGEAALRESTTLAQVLAAGGATDSESATQLQRLMQRFSNIDIQRRARRMGIDLTEGGELGGALRPLLDIAQDLNASGKNNPVALTQLLGQDIRSRQGLQTILRVSQNREFMDGIAEATAEGGEEFVDRFQRNMEASGILDIQRLRTNQLADFQDQGGLQSDFARTIVKTVGTMTRYETAHLELIEALGAAKAALLGIAGVSIAGRLLGASGAASGAAGAAGAAAGLGAGGVAAVGGVGAVLGYRVSEDLTGSGSVLSGGIGAFNRRNEELENELNDAERESLARRAWAARELAARHRQAEGVGFGLVGAVEGLFGENDSARFDRMAQQLQEQIELQREANQHLAQGPGRAAAASAEAQEQQQRRMPGGAARR